MNLDVPLGSNIGDSAMAQSMGHIGKHAHPDVQATIKQVLDSANRHKMPWGIPTAKLGNFQKYTSMVGTILTLGSETSVLRTYLLGVIEELKGKLK